MKKLFVTIGVVMTITLSGCGSTNVQSISDFQVSDKESISRFLILENTDAYYVLVDRETKVMYAMSNGVYNTGIFTALLDASGKPLLYEGVLE